MIRLLKRLFRRTTRSILSGRNSRLKTWALTYVLALFPANYVTTAVTTASNLANPTQVMQVMQDKNALSSFTGLLNTATGGLLKPLGNGVLAITGSAMQSIGNAVGMSDFADTGKRWIDSANEWFTAGKSALENIRSSSSSDEWDKSIPNYYKVVGHADTSDKVVSKVGDYKYADLDSLGRSGVAEAVIGIDAIEKSAGTREQFEKGSDPSGWGYNLKVEVNLMNGKVYNGYAWNRSHLIADSLGGRAYRNNLITGTRMQNVGANDLRGGMQYIERKVLDYIKSNQSVTVWYRATPIYQGNELVPRTVIVDAVSSDNSINERVITYNVLPGYKIDYKNGKITKGT